MPKEQFVEWFRSDGVPRHYQYKEDDQNMFVDLVATSDCRAFREAAQYVKSSGVIFEKSDQTDVPDFKMAILTRGISNRGVPTIYRTRPEIAD